MIELNKEYRMPREGYFLVNKENATYKKFNKGDIIHSIPCHYLEDEYGNDVDQEMLFVNPDIIDGTYKVESEGYKEGDYACIIIEDKWGNNGKTAYIGGDVIWENYH